MQRIEGAKSMSEHLQKRFGRTLSEGFLYKAMKREAGDNPLRSRFELGERIIEVLELESWFQQELARTDERRRRAILHRRSGKPSRRKPLRANRKS